MEEIQVQDIYNKDFGALGVGLYGSDSLFATDGLGGFLNWMVETNKTLPGYWSPRRDLELRKAVITNNFLSSAVYTIQLLLYGIKFAVVAKDTSIEKHLRVAEEYDAILKESLSSKHFEMFLADLLTCDNGGFLFIDGAEPMHKPLSGMPFGLIHLDSLKCQRTGETEFPVVYYTTLPNGEHVGLRIHYSRIFELSQMPSTNKGVGFSFVSRAFSLAETLLDIQVYESEILGTRSSEEVIYATGAKSSDLQDAFKAADLDSDNSGLIRVGKRVFLGFRDPNSTVGKLMLKNLPENFNKRDYVEITLTLFSIAAGISANSFYDSVKSGSTRASAQISDVVNQRKLPSWYVQKMINIFSKIFLPKDLKLVLPEEDKDTDGTLARIKSNLALAREKNLNSGVSTIRVEREKQFANGEISQSQFETLELEDGRLIDGLPIQALFLREDALLQKLLIVDKNPLDFKNNDILYILDEIDIAIQNALSISINGRTSNQQKSGKLAYYALNWLKKQYIQIKDGYADSSNVLIVEDHTINKISNDINKKVEFDKVETDSTQNNETIEIDKYNEEGTEKVL